MKREEIADLMAFVVVAEERSFTRAAARLSMAQSALSQIVRRIETVGLRLLTRTTRSVVPTEAGEHLLSVLGPMLHDIDSALASLSNVQNRRSGTMRITTVEHAAKTICYRRWRFLKSHPEIDIQLTIDYGLTDVVSERFDAGVRLGGGDGSRCDRHSNRASYTNGYCWLTGLFFSPKCPTSVSQLIDHQAINLYLPTSVQQIAGD